ncbi:hypothetical protein FSARC_7467 [Fusarium sarcochroum]|uniref:Uncharacterized protein n=1 Tax=Fusarium sarcochroum TaxID=1208366 RepID=A0A8H4X7Z3_9HYPO|nr:hypothetical protein FSARC_7467 [Fusarium sarcochroum]
MKVTAFCSPDNATKYGIYSELAVPKLEPEQDNLKEIQQHSNHEDDPHAITISRPSSSDNELKMEIQELKRQNQELLQVLSDQKCNLHLSLDLLPVHVKGLLQGHITVTLFLSQSEAEEGGNYQTHAGEGCLCHKQREQCLKLVMSLVSLIPLHLETFQMLYEEAKGVELCEFLNRICGKLKPPRLQGSFRQRLYNALDIPSRQVITLPPNEIETPTPLPISSNPLWLAISIGLYLRRWNLTYWYQDESTVVEIAQRVATVFRTHEIHRPLFAGEDIDMNIAGQKL